MYWHKHDVLNKWIYGGINNSATCIDKSHRWIWRIPLDNILLNFGSKMKLKQPIRCCHLSTCKTISTIYLYKYHFYDIHRFVEVIIWSISIALKGQVWCWVVDYTEVVNSILFILSSVDPLLQFRHHLWLYMHSIDIGRIMATNIGDYC